jgi:hypothetical protein
MNWLVEDPCNRVMITAGENLARYQRHQLRDMLRERYGDTQWTQSFLKTRIMSYRSWTKACQSMTGQEVALDDCVKMILRDFASPTGTEHELVIISDAGVVEKPDVGIAARAFDMHEQMKERFGQDWSTE